MGQSAARNPQLQTADVRLATTTREAQSTDNRQRARSAKIYPQGTVPYSGTTVTVTFGPFTVTVV